MVEKVHVSHLLYLIGQPGSGKSTLCEALTAPLSPSSVEERPFPHIVWPGGVVELGARRPKFSGTDALSMSVQPKVLAWLEEEAPGLVLGEGDRLANGKFFAAVLTLGWSLQLVRLAVSSPVAEQRRYERSQVLGKAQSAAWVAGRITKARHLAADWADYVVTLDADYPPDRVLSELMDLHDPVVTALRRYHARRRGEA